MIFEVEIGIASTRGARAVNEDFAGVERGDRNDDGRDHEAENEKRSPRTGGGGAARELGGVGHGDWRLRVPRGWRRGRDLNPRWVAPYRISSAAP